MNPLASRTAAASAPVRSALLAAAIVGTLGLTACSAPGADPSTQPVPDNGFCGAMAAAASAFPEASAALDALLAAASDESLLEPNASTADLNAAGATTVTAGNGYASTLAAAAAAASADLADDLATLEDYWSLYAADLGQIAADASTYDGFVEAARPLLTSDQTATLIADQPGAAGHVASVYASTCSS